MEKLIVKYLQGNLTLQEQHQLSKWLEEDERNPDILRKLEIYWKDHALDLEATEKRVKAKLVNRIGIDKIPQSKSTFYSIGSFLRIAAVIILGMTIVFSVYMLKDKQGVKEVVAVSYIEKKSDPGEKVTVQLPDGSTVKLNSGSSIIYPDTFTDNIREVVLKGEGFFEVTKNEQKPFVVKVDKVLVKVLGTSFNINTHRSTNQVIVGVKTGQVKVSDQSENISRVLNPDELVIYDSEVELMEFKKIIDHELIFGWTDQLLVFNDDQFHEVLSTLSYWYGVEFTLEKNIDSKRVFTSKFKNPTLKSVMESLSYVYDFKYRINENSIIIK